MAQEETEYSITIILPSNAIELYESKIIFLMAMQQDYMQKINVQNTDIWIYIYISQQFICKKKKKKNE